ncbi:hypothetical protein D3C80_1359250 [compost metagenome]
MKLKALIQPMRSTIAMGIIQNPIQKRFKPYSNKRTATKCDKNLGKAGNGYTSSIKLIRATNTTAAIKKIDIWPRIKATKTAIGKIIPPPRKVMAVCEERWLGLSIILNLSAILK